LGNDVAIITGRKSKIVEKRAKELGIKYLFQAVDNKKKILEELLERLNISFEEVAIIGDDLNDYNMLKLVKNSFTPADGVDNIKSLVNTILNKNGGDGAVREMIDILIENNNQKEQFISLWTDIK
jgi:3-deoxy-D-manno-octulosonate 8-phosphate phosphatase (KDO 8-P phosphatase)